MAKTKDEKKKIKKAVKISEKFSKTFKIKKVKRRQKSKKRKPSPISNGKPQKEAFLKTENKVERPEKKNKRKRAK